MSFGWSASDVVAALKFLHRIGSALREAGGASSDYQNTITFLQTFSHTIQHLHAIQVTSLDPVIAQDLRDHCGQIKDPLQAFLEDAHKFESSLGRDVKSKRKILLGTGRKIQWAVVLKNKVKVLQDRVEIPMASISIILGQQILWVSKNSCVYGVVKLTYEQEPRSRKCLMISNPEYLVPLKRQSRNTNSWKSQPTHRSLETIPLTPVR